MMVSVDRRTTFRFEPGGDLDLPDDDRENGEMTMMNPPHPGLSVKHDCLEPLGLSVTKGAEILGVTRDTLNDLVNGRRGISPEMALRLDMAFGGGADTWLRLQAAYDLAQARRKADQLKVKRVAPLGA
jgi:addiction module HigA family antidote